MTLQSRLQRRDEAEGAFSGQRGRGCYPPPGPSVTKRPSLKCPAEEPTPESEDDKQPLHSNATGTRGGGRRGSENETATPLPPLEGGEEEEEKSGSLGRAERGWEQHLSPEWETQASQQRSEAGGHRGYCSHSALCLPGALLFFLGYNEGGVSPSPQEKRAVNTGPIRA